MYQIVTILFITWSLLLSGNTMEAQQSGVSAKEALELFNEGAYQQAIPLYEALLERYDREPNLNYYYGVCLLESKTQNGEAIKRLKFASLKNVNRDVFYYLGRAYQNAYEFQEAIKQYTHFLKVTHPEDARRVTAQRSIEDCQSAIELINKYFKLSILAKDTVSEQEVLSKYQLSGESGTLSPNRTFFKTGVDPDQIMYKTELENEVLFVLEQPDSGRYNINKIVRLLDSWSKNQDLGTPINSEFDERYPFMLVDGTTFYFSSNRPGGMGGMDIYQSYFDTESNTFSPPENMGPPFNSPDDDYLFAADAFENQAWFSTNRGVSPGKAVVVMIRWDNSVIKNLARDTEQIRQLAQLPLLERDSTDLETARPSTPAQQKLKAKEDFRFYINDTLVYSRFEHFHSAEALNAFKKGFDLNAQKDSLELLMEQKRKIYSLSYNKEELKQLIDEILQLEQQVYGLTDQIQNHYITARRLEISKINELKANGTYRSSQKERESSSPKKTLESRQPTSHPVFANDEFHGPREEIQAMYRKFFSDSEINVLEQSDSLYAWANSLKLKAANMLEKGHPAENMESRIPLLDRIKNKDTLSTPEALEVNYALEARATEKKALDIYHEALDQKYRIYYPKLTQLEQLPKNKHFADSLGRIRAFYDEATEGLEKMYTYNQERYERLGSLKREAVSLMERILLNSSLPTSAASTTNQTHFNNSPSSNSDTAQALTITQKSNAEIASPASSGKRIPSQVIASAFEKSETPVFKVQIGVFSSSPRQESLAKIPDISTSPVAGKNLVKYFSGQWKSFQQAQEQVASIREAGFDGAFVVAFLNGHPIPIEKARAIGGEPTKNE